MKYLTQEEVDKLKELKAQGRSVEELSLALLRHHAGWEPLIKHYDRTSNKKHSPTS